LRRPKLPIKGGSAPEQEEEEGKKKKKKKKTKKKVPACSTLISWVHTRFQH